MKCPKCGYKYDDLSTVQTYTPSSATAYMSSFGHICDILKTFEGKAIKNELIVLKLLDEKLLESYVKWDILERDGIYYKLTTLGKEFFIKNKEWRKK